MENNLKTNLKLLKARSNLVKAIQSIGLNSVSATKNKFLKNKETAPRFLYSSEPTKKKKHLDSQKERQHRPPTSTSQKFLIFETFKSEDG